MACARIGREWWGRLYWRWLLILVGILVACSDVDQSADDEAVDTVSEALCAEARLTVVAASASSQESSSLSAAKAVDNNASTRWGSTFADPQWLQLDLGSSKTVSRVVFKWETAASRHYLLQVSDDGVLWRTRFIELQGNGGTDEITNLNATGRYVRIYSHARTTNYGVSLWEVELYGSSPSCAQPSSCGQSPLVAGSATASSVESSAFPASKAIDGNLSSRWSSAFSDPQWLKLDLGANRYVTRVVLRWETAASRRYDLQISNDGNTWSNIYSDTGIGNGGVDDIGALSAAGRYLRVFSHARTTTFGVSLFEVEVFGDTDTSCSTAPPCNHPFIRTLSNGDVEFKVTLPGQQQYVEVFVRQDGVQNVAQNIVGSAVANGDGTYTYKYVKAASHFDDGDVLVTRFYSYKPNSAGVFTPGPGENVWSAPFVYGVTCEGSCAAQPDIPIWRQTGVCSDATLDADLGVCLNEAEAARGGTQTIHPIDDAVIPSGTFPTDCSLTFVVESFEYLHDGAGFQNVFGWYPARKDANDRPIAPATNDLHVLFDCGDGPGSMADPIFPASVSEVGFFVASNGNACVPTSGGVLTSAPQRIVYSERELNPCAWDQMLEWQSKASPNDAYWGFEDLVAGSTNPSAPDFDFEDLLLFVERGTCGPCTSDQDCSGDLVCLPKGICGEPMPCTGPPDCAKPICTETAQCPGDEVCPLVPNGERYGMRGQRVCEPVGCCDEPSEQGTTTLECGTCVCVPDCSDATCADPSNGCGGECPGVCDVGECGCKLDLHCAPGHACVTEGECGVCRPEVCAVQELKPPLCGSPNAPCGEECPTCVPACGGRECGSDPQCGSSCGTCAAGSYCNADGRCVSTSFSDPPIRVPDGLGGTKDLPDLPSPPATPIGAVAGQFSVSDFGSAQYDIPIDVPPGRAGMEPNLSIRYNGSRVNGEAGVGWRLEGLSQITRCPRVNAIDGYSAPVKNDSSDVFCIDGKRLVKNGAGEYGGDGTEYRTIIDSFSKIVSHDVGEGFQFEAFPASDRVANELQGPDHFEVFSKDGRILTYGKTRDSLTFGRDGVRYTWLLNRIQDRAGNTIDIHYENRPGFSAFSNLGIVQRVRPSKIQYTGHQDTAGNREVRFTYEERADSRLSFVQGGSALFIGERLAQITTYVRGKPVKNYRLAYDALAVSQINEVRECEGDGEQRCKPPTKFEYNHVTGFQQGGLGASEPTAGQLDVNGDGIPDFLSTTVFREPVGADPTMQAIAIGADVAVGVGSMFLAPVGGFAVNVVWAVVKGPFWGLFADDPVYHFKHSIDIGTGNRADPTNFFSSAPGLPCETASTFLLDYDQDGKDDVVMACDMMSFKVGRSLGDGSFAPHPSNAAVVRIQPAVAAFFSVPRPILYDVDGDSLQDAVGCVDRHTLEVRRRLGPDQGFAEVPLQIVGTTHTLPLPVGQIQEDLPFCSSGTPSYKILDVDGDGAPELMAHLIPRPDIALFTGAKPGWHVLRFTRAGGSPRLAWETIDFPDSGNSPYGEGMLLGDLNDDGLSDVWRVNPGNSPTATIWINTGRGNFVTKDVFRPLPAHDEDSRFRFSRATLIDYNGDGRLDPVERWSRGSEIFDHRNVVLVQGESLLSGYTDIYNPDDLLFHFPGSNAVGAGPFSRAGDLDADGSPDLFGTQGGQTFFGVGGYNMMLEKVTDGLGKVTQINYDHAADTYSQDCSDERVWPERCLKRMKGLVSRHREGFVDANDDITFERTYDYKYFNARVNVTGHSWLGFDRRSVTQVSNDVSQSVVTEFEPPARYTLDGQPKTSTAPPYVYPLAGLVRRVIIDDSAGDPSNFSPLEDTFYARRTVVRQRWAVEQSDAGRAFPTIAFRETSTYARPFNLNAPFDDHGLLRTTCEENIDVDAFANVTSHEESCQTESDQLDLEETIKTTVFVPDASTWLISNPEHVTILSRRLTPSGNHEQTQIWDPTYDSRGLLATIKRDPGGPAQRTTTYVRNAYGNIEQVILSVPSGEPARPTTIDYDGDEIFPSSMTNALGHTSYVRYDRRFGTVITAVDPNGIAVRSAFDGLGLLAETRGPAGTTIYSYAQLPGQPTETSAGLVHPRFEAVFESQGTEGSVGERAAQEYDHYGRLVRSRVRGFGGDDVVAEQAYDAHGRVERSSLPHLEDATFIPVQRFVHDFLGRLVEIEHPDGTSIKHHYASGVTLSSQYGQWLAGIDCPGSSWRCAVDVELATDEEGKQNVLIRDHRGQVVSSVDGQNIASGDHAPFYEYGAFNRLRRIEDNANNVTSFVFDAYGRLESEGDPDVGTSQYTYNGFDEVRTSVDPGVQFRQFTFDKIGRIAEMVDGAGTTTWIYDQGASAIGELSESISPSGQRIQYSYEPATADRHRGSIDSVSYVIDGTTYTLGMDYDDRGRIDVIEYPDLGSGAPVRAKYDYDPASGILSAVSEIGGGSTRPIWRVDSTFEGHLLEQETFGNGATTTRSYHDQRRWLRSLSTSLAGETIQDLQYERYDNGQIQQQIRPDKTHTFTYDELRRLSSRQTTGSSPTQYEYDTIGNLTRRGSTITTYRANQPHLVEQVGSANYEYDANGNLSERIGPGIPGGLQTFEYTSFDLPKRITTGAGVNEQVTQFDYTADADRVVRRDSEGTRHFATDLYQRLESPTGDTLEQRYRLLAGERVVAEIVRAPAGEETLYFHEDHLGTPETISDTGGASFHQDYDPFGDLVGGAPALNTELTRTGFTGHQQDSDLGLIDMDGRVYDPIAARFTTPDPITQAPFWSQGLNRYSYVFNDPVNLTDPSGFMGMSQEAVGVQQTAGAMMSNGLIPTSAFVLLRNVGAANLGVGLGGIALNLTTTLLDPPFAGSAGSKVSVAPTSVASPTFSGQGGSPAASLNKPSLPDVGRGPIPALPQMPGLCALTGACLAQNAGGPSSGASGSANSGNLTMFEDDGSVTREMLLFFAPMPSLAKIKLLWQMVKYLKVLRGISKVPIRVFQSFAQFKKIMGPAGKNKVWHHIVLKYNEARFGAEAIHNTANVVAIDAATHYKVHSHFEKIMPWTNGLKVREWLATQSFEAQSQYGMEVLQRAMLGLPLP